MKTKKLLYLVCFFITLTFFSCSSTKIDTEIQTSSFSDDPINRKYLYWGEDWEEKNPKYSSRTEALDTIFNPDELGQMVLVLDRSEWNKQLEYCDINLDHEECVVAKGFYFKKDNKEWFFKDIGFRIRGNTSRIRPQDEETGKYVQSHFSLDFEEWTDDDKKLANSMKGIILKRFKNDPTYVREVYGYNLFRENGVWISPRASYTRLVIQIVDDLDLDNDGNITEFETVDYGVYAMIEEIKKQFLKERTEEQNGGNLVSNKGNLWKCSWGADFTVPRNQKGFGEESSEIIFDANGNIENIDVKSYTYDYKGDNDFTKAKSQLIGFMAELALLPNCIDGRNDKEDIEKIKGFYTERIDGDLLLQTYAVNVILGMWDDYWVNKNNFYFYFDTDGKAYFIPYDYDNVLGINNCGVNSGIQNPMLWGNLKDGERPLIQKMLQVPEYMELYREYLRKFSDENSFFDDDNSIAKIKQWQAMIEPYINSKDLQYNYNSKMSYFDTTPFFMDVPAYWSEPYVKYTLYTEGTNNFFTVRQRFIKKALDK